MSKQKKKKRTKPSKTHEPPAKKQKTTFGHTCEWSSVPVVATRVVATFQLMLFPPSLFSTKITTSLSPHQHQPPLGTEKGDHFIKGRWTKQESDLLQQTIKEYAVLHNIDVARLAERKSKGSRSSTSSDTTVEISSKAWIDIANSSGLTKRTLQSIYTHGCRVCDPRNYKGKWSTEEVENLTKLVEKHGTAWSKIAEEIGRERRGVQQKWNNLNNKKKSSIARKNTSASKTGKWSDEEITLLKTLVRKHSIGNSTWPVSGIKWVEVHKQIPGRNIASISKRWSLLFTSVHKWTRAEESALAEAVKSSNPSCENDVPWSRMGTLLKDRFVARPGHQYRIKYDGLRKRTDASCMDKNTTFVDVKQNIY